MEVMHQPLRFEGESCEFSKVRITTWVQGVIKALTSSIAQPSWRKSSESSDFSDSASEHDDLASWISNNPSFSFNVPPGWKLSTSTTDSQSESDRASPAPGRFTSSAASDTSRSTSLSWDVVRPPSSFATESVASPTADHTKTFVGDSEATEGTPQLTPAVPQQLRPLPNGLQMKLPAKDPVFLKKQTEGGGAVSPSPTTSVHTPRRPPLPPTTPNDELPPPSPRPSHARPSPLPRVGFPSRAIDPASSPFQNVASASTSTNTGVGAIYRAPEDLAVPSSSYFPPSDDTLTRAHNEDVGSEDGEGIRSEQSKTALTVDPPHARPEDMQPALLDGTILRVCFTVVLGTDHCPILRADPAGVDVLALAAPLGPVQQDEGPIDDLADDGGDQGDAPEGGEEDLDGLLEGRHNGHNSSPCGGANN